MGEATVQQIDASGARGNEIRGATRAKLETPQPPLP